MNSNTYEDIINLPHYEPKHKRMSISVRSAQFSPFAALTGFSDAVKETERIVDKQIILDEEVKEKINIKLQEILSNIKSKPEITISYFKKDQKKDGGEYITIVNKVKKIDMIEKYILLQNKEKIYFEDIVKL